MKIEYFPKWSYEPIMVKSTINNKMKYLRVSPLDKRLKSVIDARSVEHSYLLNEGNRYWQKDNLVFAYALACAQMVLSHSNPGDPVDTSFRVAKEAWGRPDCLAAMNEFVESIILIEMCG
jgi:hypothetical protein